MLDVEYYSPGTDGPLPDDAALAPSLVVPVLGRSCPLAASVSPIPVGRRWTQQQHSSHWPCCCYSVSIAPLFRCPAAAAPPAAVGRTSRERLARWQQSDGWRSRIWKFKIIKSKIYVGVILTSSVNYQEKVDTWTSWQHCQGKWNVKKKIFFRWVSGMHMYASFNIIKILIKILDFLEFFQIWCNQKIEEATDLHVELHPALESLFGGGVRTE